MPGKPGMKGETADAGAEGLKGEPGTPVCYIFDIDHIVFVAFEYKINKKQYYHICLLQGIDGLPGEKADKGSKGDPGLNVSNILPEAYENFDEYS